MKEEHTLIPSEKLRQRILTHISRDERRRARIYVLTSAVVTVLSLTGIVVSVQYVVQTLYQSSSYAYLSLLFSDTDIVFANWQAFSLSLLESVPLIGILLSLIATFSFLVSIRTLANNVRAGLMPSFSN